MGDDGCMNLIGKTNAEKTLSNMTNHYSPRGVYKVADPGGVCQDLDHI